MDKKIVLKWLAAIVARGLAWVFAAKLGLEAAEARDQATAAAEALCALTLVAVSIYTSLRGRKKLLGTAQPG